MERDEGKFVEECGNRSLSFWPYFKHD